MKTSAVLTAALLAGAEAMKVPYGPRDMKRRENLAASLQAVEAPMAVRMSTLRGKKEAHFEASRLAGAYDAHRYQAQGPTACSTNGTAGEYSCRNVDLKGFLRHQDMGSVDRFGNDIWGK